MSHKKKSHMPDIACSEVTKKDISAILSHEITWWHCKSGGHGWQNVNKRHTTAEWYFNIVDSDYLNQEQKQWLLAMYHNHVNHDGELRLICREERNYHRNLEILKKHYTKVFELAWKESMYTWFHHKRH